MVYGLDNTNRTLDERLNLDSIEVWIQKVNLKNNEGLIRFDPVFDVNLGVEKTRRFLNFAKGCVFEEKNEVIEAAKQHIGKSSLQSNELDITFTLENDTGILINELNALQIDEQYELHDIDAGSYQGLERISLEPGINYCITKTSDKEGLVNGEYVWLLETLSRITGICCHLLAKSFGEFEGLIMACYEDQE